MHVVVNVSSPEKESQSSVNADKKRNVPENTFTSTTDRKGISEHTPFWPFSDFSIASYDALRQDYFAAPILDSWPDLDSWPENATPSYSSLPFLDDQSSYLTMPKENGRMEPPVAKIPGVDPTFYISSEPLKTSKVTEKSPAHTNEKEQFGPWGKMLDFNEDIPSNNPNQSTGNTFGNRTSGVAQTERPLLPLPTKTVYQHSVGITDSNEPTQASPKDDEADEGASDTTDYNSTEDISSVEEYRNSILSQGLKAFGDEVLRRIAIEMVPLLSSGNTFHSRCGTAGSSSSSCSNHQESSVPTNTYNSLKRKRQQESDGSDLPGSNGDEAGKRKKHDPSIVPNIFPGVKYACPYFKNDPTTCGSCRACAGPGWNTIHRTK
jgi:hypothetical protein